MATYKRANTRQLIRYLFEPLTIFRNILESYLGKWKRNPALEQNNESSGYPEKWQLNYYR